MTFFFYAAIIGAALVGAGLAGYIHFTKRLHKPLTCPIGYSCDTVIHSKFSRFMDIPVELLGLLYYSIIAAAYLFFLFTPSFNSVAPFSALLALTSFAFLFSLYLTAVQAFILRQWCTWCLFSAFLCTVIFAAAVKLYGIGFVELFSHLF